MNAKDAARLAVDHIVDLFESEKLSNVGLEEVELNDDTGHWTVTVGFSRPWDYPRNALLNITQQEPPPKRAYKIVTIEDASRAVLAIKNRELA